MAGLGLEIDGLAPTAECAAALVQVEVHQALNVPSLAVLTFVDLPANAAAPGIGSRVTVRAPAGGLLFEGEATGVRRTLGGSGERSLEIRAYDPLHRLRKRQSLRQLADLSLTDIATQLVSDIGLSVQAVAELPQARPVIVQHDQSDFDLLTQCAADSAVCFWLSGDRLRILSLGGDGDDEVRLVVGENILEITADISAEAMRKECTAIGWNLAANEVHSERVGTAAQDSLEMRMDALAAFDALGSRFLPNRLVDTADMARCVAQSDIDRATARGLILDALCEGDPDLRPGRVVRLEGLGAETDGPFVVTAAVHRFDAGSGYTVRIGTAPPDVTCDRRAIPFASLGIVVDVEDPEARSRVKARFPVLGDVNGHWMPVVALGAGESKGLTIIPELDDEVLVLFPDGDPGRGIVLGGLYGSRAALGQRPPQGARSFVLRSPSGPQLTFDGGKALIRLESGDGDLVEIGPEGTIIRARQNMTIEAPGRTLKIRAANVEFERA